MMMAYAEKRRTLIEADIKRDGRQILGVPDGEPAPFAYTIGNELKGLPELLVVGVSRKAGFLNLLSDMMVERGAPFAEGEIVDLGGKHPVKIINADAVAKAEYTIQASNFHGHDRYRVQQVLVPDPQGLFPDDGRCDPRYRMPVLSARGKSN
jgi:hypothetical protein